MPVLAALTADATLDAAFAWLCKRRRDYPSSADVWDFRDRWPQEKPRIRADLGAGRTRFGLLDRVVLTDGEEIDVWPARDALVLKALTIALQPALPVSRHCTHIRGHGGAKAAVRRLIGQLAANHFVMRSDVKSYYASIDHHLLLDRLVTHIKDKAVLSLIGHICGARRNRAACYSNANVGFPGLSLEPIDGGALPTRTGAADGT